MVRLSCNPRLSGANTEMSPRPAIRGASGLRQVAKANGSGAISGVKNPLQCFKRVNRGRKKKAPKDAATAVGMRSDTTEP